MSKRASEPTDTAAPAADALVVLDALGGAQAISAGSLLHQLRAARYGDTALLPRSART